MQSKQIDNFGSCELKAAWKFCTQRPTIGPILFEVSQWLKAKISLISHRSMEATQSTHIAVFWPRDLRFPVNKSRNIQLSMADSFGCPGRASRGGRLHVSLLTNCCVLIVLLTSSLTTLTRERSMLQKKQSNGFFYSRSCWTVAIFSDCVSSLWPQGEEIPIDC